MDPFSSFDLFRRRVDQMFSDYDQQMFGADPFLDAFSPHPRRQASDQPTLSHDKSPSARDMKDKDEERIIPHASSRNQQHSGQLTTTGRQADRSLAPHEPSSSALGLYNWPAATLPSMKMDIIEDKDKFLVHADVPGFTKDQLHISVKNGNLIVSGNTSESHDVRDPDRRYHRVERSSGNLYRSIRLPEHIKQEDISAACEHGVLKVTLPKMETIQHKNERKIIIE